MRFFVSRSIACPQRDKSRSDCQNKFYAHRINKKNMNKINLVVEKHLFSTISAVLIVSLLVWLSNFSVWVNKAQAAQLGTISDTLSTSKPLTKSNHTIKFVLASSVTASSTIALDFADSFSSTSSPAFAITDPLDFDIATSTSVSGAFTDLGVVAAGLCPGSGLSKFEITSTSTTNVFTFTHCNGTDAVSANTAIAVEIGTNATSAGAGDSQLTNAASGSYVLTVTAPSTDSASTRIAIIDDVVMSASVATNFTFTIAGVASGENINGDAIATSAGATATALPFGELTAGAAKVLGQTLSVSTNARNGFAVTVQEDQDLLSANGATIDLFKDGAGTATPVAWASPLGTIDQANTYGHFGFTSEDADLNSDEFGSALYAGNASSTPRTVFSHTGPANGSTANKGQTRVGVKIEISALQEAAGDYTNRLTYVATPTF